MSDVTSADGRARFARSHEQMEPLLVRLLAAPRLRFAEHPTVPAVPGVYLFGEREVSFYVGQSRNLRRRLRIHTRASSTHRQASFAFNLARRSAGDEGADLSRTRAALAADPVFAEHFRLARLQVAAMHVQFVEVEDPITRTMFEMFASLVLGTADFNSFETH